MLKIHEEYKVVDSTDLNEHLKAKYNKEYSCVQGVKSSYDDVHQEMYKEYEIGPAEEDELGIFYPTETTLEDHNEALENWENWKTSPDPGIMLNELCRLGEIPAGTYLLMIWW